MYFRAFDKQKQVKFKTNWWKDIIKVRTEVNKVEIYKETKKQSWFFEKINKNGKVLAKLTKKKKKRGHKLIKLVVKRETFTVNSKEIQKVV